MIFDNMDEKVHPSWVCVENFIVMSYTDPKLYSNILKYFRRVEDSL